jgi:hypothetical protein
MIVKKGHPQEGRIYIGQLKNGMMHGHGEYRYKDGARLIGRFENDQFNGVAEHQMANQEIFRGTHADDMRHGLGMYLFGDGEKWIGEFHRGVRHGRGIRELRDKIKGIVRIPEEWNGPERKRLPDGIFCSCLQFTLADVSFSGVKQGRD